MPSVTYSIEDLRTAREEVRNELGKELEAKASDAFCITVHARGSHPVPAIAMEAMGLPTPSAAPTPHIPTVVGFGDALIRRPTLERKEHGLRATERQLLIQESRNRAYEAMSPVYAEIDRQSHSSLGSVPEALRASSAPIVQLCWLNRTVRTWADPEVLSEIARDSSVTNIDVTRRIQPDVQSENHKAIGHPATTGPTLGATGRGVTVAIIDSEVQLQHAALGSSRVVPKRNYTSEPWGTPDAHGTAIAGIIGADFTGHMGLAPEVTMYNYKVMATNRWANAFGWDGARAIQDAVEDGADVINCSWGVGSVREQMSIEAIAITNAVSVFGVGVVKSAGNAGPDAGTLTAPAEAEGVIVVGATDVGGTEVQDYSSRGPAGNKAGPDIVAPGGSDGNPLICCLHTGGFGNAGYGTSYAAPHATGVVALLVENASAEPTDLPNDFRKRIMDGAVRLHGWGEKDQGTGLMRA